MDELISRQAAIDAILHITNCKSVRELFEYNQEHHLTEMWSGGVNDAIDAVIGVESATDNNVATKLGTNLASLGTDCISREQAIDALRAMQTYKLFAGDDMLLIDQAGAQTELMLLPSAEPKRGKWIDKGVYTYVDDHRHLYKCDQCGNGWLDTPDFCPNCGADMRKANRKANNESN